MRYFLLLLIVFFVFGCVGKDQQQKMDEAAHEDPLAEFCKSAPCRKNVDIRLKKKDGTYFEFKSKLSPPVVQGDLLTIYANEKVYIEVESGEKGPVNLKHVKEIKNPGNTIVLEFKQDRKRDKGSSMVLIVYNPLKRTLDYKLGIMPLGAEGFQAAASRPVRSRGKAYIHWPFPAFQLMVSGMEFIND